MSSPERKAPPWTRRALVAGAIVLAVGLWMVADALGISPPPLSGHWPLFVILAGIASILDFAAISRRAGALGLGIFGVGLGIVLYLLVQDVVGWKGVRLWIPGVLLAIGLGSLATWTVSPNRSPRTLITGVAFSGLAVTFWGWREIPLGLFWGVLLLVLGGAILWRVVTSRSTGTPGG